MENDDKERSSGSGSETEVESLSNAHQTKTPRELEIIRQHGRVHSQNIRNKQRSALKMNENEAMQLSETFLASDTQLNFKFSTIDTQFNTFKQSVLKTLDYLYSVKQQSKAVKSPMTTLPLPNCVSATITVTLPIHNQFHIQPTSNTNERMSFIRHESLSQYRSQLEAYFRSFVEAVDSLTHTLLVETNIDQNSFIMNEQIVSCKFVVSTVNAILCGGVHEIDYSGMCIAKFSTPTSENNPPLLTTFDVYFDAQYVLNQFESCFPIFMDESPRNTTTTPTLHLLREIIARFNNVITNNYDIVLRQNTQNVCHLCGQNSCDYYNLTTNIQTVLAKLQTLPITNELKYIELILEILNLFDLIQDISCNNNQTTTTNCSANTNENNTLTTLCLAITHYIHSIRVSNLLPKLFDLIKNLNITEGVTLNLFIQQCQKRHSNIEIRSLMKEYKIVARDAMNLDVGMELLNQVLSIDPLYLEASYQRSIHNAILNLNTACCVDIKNVLIEVPNHWEALCGKGKMLMKCGQFQRALKTFNLAAAINPHIIEQIRGVKEECVARIMIGNSAVNSDK